MTLADLCNWKEIASDAVKALGRAGQGAVCEKCDGRDYTCDFYQTDIPKAALDKVRTRIADERLGRITEATKYQR